MTLFIDTTGTKTTSNIIINGMDRECLAFKATSPDSILDTVEVLDNDGNIVWHGDLKQFAANVRNSAKEWK